MNIQAANTPSTPSIIPAAWQANNVLYDLYGSDRFVKPPINFPSPREIYDPVIERLQDLNMNLNLIGRKAGKVVVQEDDAAETEHVAYGQTALLAEVTDAQLDVDSGYRMNFGFVARFDTRNPTIQVCLGTRLYICENLMIWRADKLHSFSYAGYGLEGPQEALKRMVDEFEKTRRSAEQTVQRLRDTVWQPTEAREVIGDLFIDVAVSGAVDQIILRRAVERIYGEKVDTQLYQQGRNEPLSAERLLNAMTYEVSNSDRLKLDRVFPKTLEIYQTIEPHLN